MRVITGRLDWYWEQGWEGDFWLVLEEDGVAGYEGMDKLEPGDRLDIWDETGKVLFDGPLPRRWGRWVLVFFRREPRLPPGFFDWFKVHHHRARLTKGER